MSEGEGVRGGVLHVTITVDRDRVAATVIVIEMTIGESAEEEGAEMMMTLLGLIESTNLKVGEKSNGDDAAKVAADRGAGVAEVDVDVVDRPLNKGGGAIRESVMMLVRIPRLLAATGIIVHLEIAVAVK